jgi:hypothetical protein
MRDPWSADQVHALAPDASSLSSARGLAAPGKWQVSGGADGPPASLWGLCKGSGASPYQTCVDLDEPAYRCSCPSRKFPCKHSLGLLLMWSAGSIVEAEMPAWVVEWHEGRAARAAKSAARRTAAAEGAEPTPEQLKAAAKRAAQRDDRVGKGVADLAQWLDDQVRQGIAGLDKAGYQHFDRVAARLVDAQAPGLARQVKALAGVVSSGEGWDHRLVAELGQLRVLTRAYERLAELPEPLAETVRARVGFTVPVERVLATPAVRDTWQVLGVRDEMEERMLTRRSWLLGRDSGRFALVLAFSVAGQALPADLVFGTGIDADLHFYPGAAPLRAVIGTRHAPPARCAGFGPAGTVAGFLSGYADALAADPWTPQWPALLRGVLVPGDPWHLVDESGDALPLDRSAGTPWHLVSAAGGRPAAIAAEWSMDGLRPLAMCADAEVLAP